MMSARYVPPVMTHGFVENDIIMAPISRNSVMIYLVEEVKSKESMRITAFNKDTGEITSFSRIVSGDELSRYTLDMVATRFRKQLMDLANARKTNN